MKLYFSMLRNSLFVVRNSLFILVTILVLTGVRASAQSKPDASGSQGKRTKVQGLKPLPRDDQGREAAQEGPEFLRHRQDWFFKPRAFPLGFIPQGARERALQQKQQMYQREGRLSLFGAPLETGFVTPPIGPASRWFPIGPQPTSTTLFAGGANGGATSGRVSALVVNPNNANNVYLGGADGGLWITTDGGTTWTSLTDNPANTGIPTIAVGSLAVDPTTCGASVCTTVYVGTGEGNFSAENIYGEGVLKCAITAGTPPTASCTQDSTFHTVSPLSTIRGGPAIGALAVNPKTSGSTAILLAGVRGLASTNIPSGIWCSQDSGVTWARVLPPPTSPTSVSDAGTDVVFASDGTAWVALGNPFGDATNNGIYKSSGPMSSCASTITFAKQTLPAALSSNIGRVTLAIFPSTTSTGSNATIYAAIADSSTTSSNLLGVAKTINGGTLWTQLANDTRLTTSGVCNSQCFYDIPLAVSPASANDVFFGGAANNGTLIRSLDGGTTWTELSRNDVSGAADTIHVDMHAIAFAAGTSTMYVGNDGGVWKTTNSTLAGTPPAGFWTNLNQNLQITQFYPGVSIHPSNTGFAMGGTQDNGIQDYQGFRGSPLLWQDAGLGCDGGFTAIDFAVPSTTYGECEYLANQILLIATSFNNGDLINGFLATSGINGGDRGNFIPPLVIDPSNSNTLYFGTCLVYKTTDNANTWNPISPDVTSPAHAVDCSNQSLPALSTIAVAKGTSNTVYVGSDGGEVEVTANGGTTWTSISGNGGLLPARAVTQIVVDPSSATGDIAYVVFSGFGTCAAGCDGKGHVFKTVNGTAGAAMIWIDVSGTATKLPDIPVNALVIDPDDASGKTLYVGTDVGGFLTTDGGLNWSPLGAAGSLPNAQILSLTLHNPSRTLRAATHGRGVWDLNLGPGINTPALTIGKLSPFSATAPGAQTMLTVTGTGFTSSSKVLWNGSQRTTAFGSATQLTATITAADLSCGGVPQVSVQDVTQNPTTTGSLPFTVFGQAPTITNSVPGTAFVNAANTQITVTGTNFCSNSTVIMNPDNGGPAIATNFVSPTQLTAVVPASFMANFGSTNSVGVQNPLPGGGTTFTTSTVTLPTFTVVAPPPANDNFANAINMTSVSFTDTKDSSAATTETNDPLPPCTQASVAGSGRANTIWYKVLPTGTGSANIDTIGSSYDTVLSLWTGTSLASLTAVPNACNDDINPGIVLQSQLQNVSLTAGTTYYILVSSFGQGDTNPFAFGGKSILNFTFTGTIGGSTTGSITVTGPASAVAITAGSSGTATITVTPSGGFSGPVVVTCPAGGGPSGVTCSPLTITVPNGAPSGVGINGTLTVNVAAPSTALSASSAPVERAIYAAGLVPARSGKGWLMLSAGSGLAAMIVLLLPGRKRYRAALGLGLVCVLSFVLGCGGGSSGGGGPVPTTTKISVTSTKVTSNTPIAFSITVNASVGANGGVQLFDGSNTLGGITTVSNGLATINNPGLPPGTHAISAHYLGDPSTQASNSGMLNVTATGGPTQMVIATSPAATPTASPINITIN
ncbi:MAG TPA: Ig-like domain repeat protein [Candidatus Acidoferrum sp.]|nr:Ig-like domain repeat protein [Candidatus Acidoferrum sp.]